jgi:hypothetical protein
MVVLLTDITVFWDARACNVLFRENLPPPSSVYKLCQLDPENWGRKSVQNVGIRMPDYGVTSQNTVILIFTAVRNFKSHGIDFDEYYQEQCLRT